MPVYSGARLPGVHLSRTRLFNQNAIKFGPEEIVILVETPAKACTISV